MKRITTINRSSIETLDIKISIPRNKDKMPFTIIGIAIDHNTGYPFSPTIRSSKTITKGMQISTACMQLIKKIEKKYLGKMKKEPDHKTRKESIFHLALQERLKRNEPLSSNWKKSTEQEYIRFFERVFLELDTLQESKIIFQDDMENVVNAIKKQVQDSSLSKTNEDSNTRRAIYIVQRALAVYEIVKEAWEENNPQMPLPKIDWNPPQKRTAKREQVKSLENSIRHRLSEELYRRIEQEPAFVKSAVLMMLSLRTAEAAAVTSEDVRFAEDDTVGLYAVVKVYGQVKKRKNKVSDLKTPRSVRIIAAGYWFATMLQKCFFRIAELKECAIVDPPALSAWVLRILKKVGFDVENTKPPALYSEEIGEPAAYILRRDAGSLMMNVMGFTPYETDNNLGHSSREDEFKHEDYRHTEEQKKLVQKQNRYSYSKRITKSPSIVPIEMKHGDNQQTIEHTKLCFIAAPFPSSCSFIVQASEAGEAIRILCPKGMANNIKVYNRKRIILDKPVLGRVETDDENEY